MRTATPLPTCSTMTERGESAASAEISSPRFIGPGCITIACGARVARRRGSSPYLRVYSSGLGKNAPPPLPLPLIRSRCTRSIMIASGATSRSVASRSNDTSHGHVWTPTGRSVGGATRVTCAPSVASR